MRRLAVLIEASSPRDIQEALDDVVAAVAAGQTQGQVDENGVRIRFRWEEQAERSGAGGAKRMRKGSAVTEEVDYPHLRAWGFEVMGYPVAHVTEQVQLARDDGAPSNVIYQTGVDDDGGDYDDVSYFRGGEGRVWVRWQPNEMTPSSVIVAMGRGLRNLKRDGQV